jgi:hypothetical protein
MAVFIVSDKRWHVITDMTALILFRELPILCVFSAAEKPQLSYKQAL